MYVLTLAPQNYPRILVMALNCFSALQFVPTAPKVLAELGTKTLYKAFCPLIFPIRAFTQCHLKLCFSMTWHSWLSHFIMFQVRKGNELTDQKFMLSFAWLFSLLTNKNAILEPRKEHIRVLVVFEAKEGLL